MIERSVVIMQFTKTLFCTFVIDNAIRVEVWYDMTKDKPFKVKDDYDYNWASYDSLMEILKQQNNVDHFELTDFGKGYLCGLQKASGVIDLL